jgi:hypothetical protein
MTTSPLVRSLVRPLVRPLIGGTEPQFTPLDIANLEVWLDAMDASTVLRDTGSEFVSAANGEAVARWLDKSANAHILAQTTSGSRPLLSTSAGPTSGRCIEWDGVNDFLVKTGNLFSLPCTVFVVLRQTSWTINEVILDTAAAGNRFYLNQRNISGMLRTTGDVPTSNNGQTLGNWDIVTAKVSATAQSIRINSATPGTATSSFTATASAELRIGGNTLASNFAHVGIAAIVAYSRTLTDEEEAQVRNFLKTQYGTP